jgi:hypothetical protein
LVTSELKSVWKNQIVASLSNCPNIGVNPLQPSVRIVGLLEDPKIQIITDIRGSRNPISSQEISIDPNPETPGPVSLLLYSILPCSLSLLIVASPQIPLLQPYALAFSPLATHSLPSEPSRVHHATLSGEGLSSELHYQQSTITSVTDIISSTNTCII